MHAHSCGGPTHEVELSLLVVMQVHLQPYKHWEDNALKVAVEAHIFLVVSIALVLKFLSTEAVSDEYLGSAFYDYLLVGSFFAAIPLGFVITVCAKRSMMRESIRDSSAVAVEESSQKAKQRAIKLLHLGLTTNDDMRLLKAYFNRLPSPSFLRSPKAVYRRLTRTPDHVPSPERPQMRRSVTNPT